MKKNSLFVAGILACTVTAWMLVEKTSDSENNKNQVSINAASVERTDEGKSLDPNDQWTIIRSYPEGFDQAMFSERMEEVKLQAFAAADNRDVDLSLDWQEEGPGNIGGRINTLTVSPTNSDIIYAGAANGGIFKTIDGGGTWNPIFDDFAYLSIGALTIDPADENVLYAGTGDRNFGGGSFIGNGVYRTNNAGGSWEAIGLEETGVITEIIIDPTDSDRIFASTLGNPFEKNEHRGVYRSDDGGETWTNKLFIADSAGVVDLIMDPSNPSILYATGYNRTRSFYHSRVAGPNARIYKTIDAGETWTMLEGGLPLEDDSRIGLAISNDDPNVVYAIYVDATSLDAEEIYKTTNGGTTWSPINIHTGDNPLPDGILGGFGWYFGEVYINPHNNDQLIVPGVEMYQSLDGGETWALNVPEWWTYEVHADKHAIAFLDEDSYIIATDGGLYRTDDNGASWTDIENIAITQFYHIEVHPHISGLYGGGAQDNGSMSGNAEAFNEWSRLFGGDGFRVVFLEEDEGAAYYETQNGGLRYRAADFSTTDVSPFVDASDRVNWDMPYHINENADELFVGTSKVQMMTGAPYGWYEDISGDLTRYAMGDAFGAARYHNITEMDQPFDNADILYVGTSDGLMWRGERESGVWDWTDITGDLPTRYVTGVRCSPNNSDHVYVTFSGYKNNEEIAYLYKSEDRGETWTNISSDLPGITVNDVLIVPGYEADEYLFAGLDGGVYFSQNNGESWDYVGVGLPFVTVSELHLDVDNEKLIAGTYSRSMWSYDVSWMAEVEEPDNSGIFENGESMEQLTIYPNPASDFIHFQSVDADQANIYDSQGRLVISAPISQFNGYSRVGINTLIEGIYHLQIDGKAITSFVKQ